MSNGITNHLLVSTFVQACEGLAHAERRWFLMSAIMEETKQLQELAEYPFAHMNQILKKMQ